MKIGMLEKQLKKYVEEEFYPFHMPGHKRNMGKPILDGINVLDITEIDGFDNYHNPTAILKKEFDKAAKWYGADRSYYLVNGCSGGILAAISGVFNRGDRILMGRNCHKAVYNGVYLEELKPVYLYPKTMKGMEIYSGIEPEAVEQALAEYPDIKGVLITSPTYEGVVSDIRAIAEVVHKRGVALIVDEAHGAHFGFCKYFPESALAHGADIVIQGLHKTMPSLTQTAIMHVRTGIVDIDRITRYVSLYQTTSPSYLFMSSISSCIESMSSEQKMWREYETALKELRNELAELSHLELFETKDYAYDYSKLVIYTGNSNITGRELHDELVNQYKIQPEMSSLDYVILMTSVCDQMEHYKVLANALKSIDVKLKFRDKKNITMPFVRNELVCNYYEAMNSVKKVVPFDEALGKVSGEFVMIYPPGIPILVPGEKITEELLIRINDYFENDLEIMGLQEGKRFLIKGI